MGVVGEGRGNSMIGESKELDVPSPDKYVERDVIDLKVEFGKFQEKINNIEKNMFTKEMHAKSKLETVKWLVQILIPLFAAVLGALLISWLK